MPKKGTKRKAKTGKGKTEESETPLTNGIPFEKMFYDRATQNAALDLLQETMKKCAENVVDEMNGGSMDLRANSSKASGKVKEEKKGKKGKKKAEDVSQDENPIGFVHDLLKRYDTNRQNSRPKKRPRERLLSDSDISFDDDQLEEDYREAMEGKGKSNFLKYSVPQYELKEKLYQMHYAAIQSLSMADIINRLDEVLPELDQIRCGQLTCQRHEMFKATGLSKHELRDMTVVEPFTSSQDYCVMNAIQERLFGGQDLTENNGESLHYITNVMLQEALVRIFARVNKIDIQLAENELRFKAGYDGELSADVIKTITDTGEESD